MAYFVVKVEFLMEDEKGKQKKQRVQYLVNAMSVTESEVKVTKCLTERGESDFTVAASNPSKIIEVIN